MLILQRRVGERIVVDGGIEITVTEITKRGVRLAVSAPRGITVLRGETHDAIAVANTQAAEGIVLEIEAAVGPDASTEEKS